MISLYKFLNYVRTLAREIGISPCVIQDIRSGTRKNITLKNFLLIIDALGCDVIIKKGRRSMALRKAA